MSTTAIIIAIIAVLVITVIALYLRFAYGMGKLFASGINKSGTDTFIGAYARDPSMSGCLYSTDAAGRHIYFNRCTYV